MKLSLKLFLTVRLSAAVWSTVADCDETYNYWEPMHFLLYGKGFQVLTNFVFLSTRHLLTQIFFLDMGVFAKVQPSVVPLHSLAPAARVDIRPNRVSPSNVSGCEYDFELDAVKFCESVLLYTEQILRHVKNLQVRLLLPALPAGMRLRGGRDVLRARRAARVRAQRGAARPRLPPHLGRHVRRQHRLPPLIDVHVPGRKFNRLFFWTWLH